MVHPLSIPRRATADVTPDEALNAIVVHNRKEKVEHAMMLLEWLGVATRRSTRAHGPAPHGVRGRFGCCIASEVSEPHEDENETGRQTLDGKEVLA